MVDKELIEYALHEAENLQHSYVDVKFLERKFQQMMVKNGVLEQNQNALSSGIGVKFLVDGAYGFASTNVLTKQAIKSMKALEYAVGGVDVAIVSVNNSEDVSESIFSSEDESVRQQIFEVGATAELLLRGRAHCLRGEQ